MKMELLICVCALMMAAVSGQWAPRPAPVRPVYPVIKPDPSCCNGFTSTCYDFSEGIPSNYENVGHGVSWTQTPYNNVPCAVRGVLKLTPPARASQLKIHMDVEEASGWVYNLGDSPTCNGYSGDGGSLPYGYNAEFQEQAGTIRFYKGISAPDPNAQVMVRDAGHTHPVAYRITRDSVWATDYNSWHFHTCSNNHRVFYWNDFYLGINRVISSPASTYASGNRVGRGLCRVCIEWE